MKEPLQLHIALLAFALAVAWMVHPATVGSSMALFGAILVVMEGSAWVFLAWTRIVGRKAVEEFKRDLASMTPDQAREKTLAALKLSDHVLQSRTSSDPTLPAPICALFCVYERATFASGDLLEMGSRAQGFIEVGRTFDGARVLFREEDGATFEWDALGTPSASAPADFPTLYHWIAAQVEGWEVENRSGRRPQKGEGPKGRPRHS
jgi:hypothetical protein